MVATACSPFAGSRTARTTRAPARPSSRAATRPIPLLAPVTRKVRPSRWGRSAAVHLRELMPVNVVVSSRRFRPRPALRLELAQRALRRVAHPFVGVLGGHPPQALGGAGVAEHAEAGRGQRAGHRIRAIEAARERLVRAGKLVARE